MNKTDTLTQTTEERKGQGAKQQHEYDQQSPAMGRPSYTSNASTLATRGDGYRLRRGDPFAIFDDLQQEMARLWHQMMPWSPDQYFHQTKGMASLWAPTMDVYEQGNQLVVKAELPGVKKEDVDLAVEQGDLVISGKRESKHEDRQGNIYQSERSFGSFYRRIPLPDQVKADKVTADFRDGVLEVHVPLPAQEQPERQRIALK